MNKPISEQESSMASLESNRLFREAGRLDDEAYGLLEEQNINPATMKIFSRAKKKADAKFIEARIKWSEAQAPITSVIPVTNGKQLLS
jgi:hypothetical protein